jgi:nucleoside-diphosphate-sugar epimerase
MYQVNVVFPYRLALACNRAGVKLAHISTEFVYADNKGLPNEESLPLPSPNWYSYYKLMADNVVSLISNSYLICRLLHKSKDFNPPEVWSVETSGDTVDKIAELVIKLIRNDAYGLYNVGTGSKWLSSLVKNKKPSIVQPPKGIPTDTRMDLTKMNKFLQSLENN